MRAWGYKTDWTQLERAYFRTCVLSPDRYGAMLRLLNIFAQHLSILSNQLVVRNEQDESANMARARQFIEKHQAEPLSLGRVARVANISRHYFCKMFKKATGISFIDYLSRVRVEKSKTLLVNPTSRISEAAFASGFQSMTNFNRAFRRIVGRSPTQFRKLLPKLRRSGRNGQWPSAAPPQPKILTADDTDGTNVMNRRKPRKRGLSHRRREAPSTPAEFLDIGRTKETQVFRECTTSRSNRCCPLFRGKQSNQSPNESLKLDTGRDLRSVSRNLIEVAAAIVIVIEIAE